MKHGIWLLSHNLNNFIKSHQVATWKILSVSRKMKLFGRQESDGSTPVKCFTVEKMTIPLKLQNLLSCMYLQGRVVTVCLGESRRASAEGCAHRKGTEKRKERLSWWFVFVGLGSRLLGILLPSFLKVDGFLLLFLYYFFPSLSFLSPSPLPLREHNTWPLFKAIKLQSGAGWRTGLSICEKTFFYLVVVQSNL